MAFLEHSGGVLYHVASLLTGMAPLKSSRQHSRPVLGARATRETAEPDCPQGAVPVVGLHVRVCVFLQEVTTCVSSLCLCICMLLRGSVHTCVAGVCLLMCACMTT